MFSFFCRYFFSVRFNFYIKVFYSCSSSLLIFNHWLLFSLFIFVYDNFPFGCAFLCWVFSLASFIVLWYKMFASQLLHLSESFAVMRLFIHSALSL